ncbi:MAG: ABC transporter ATP-binding protein [Bacillota bacterium]|nr:ABC transporter ATP-binding protein [Bacillota bacterium]
MHELKLVDVQKKYKDKEAVRKFSYTFTNGVYGLLGENGAGKTTLMRLICGILQTTNGGIYCDNIEIVRMGAEYRRLLGYLPQDFGYYGNFTAGRFLRYMAALKALPEEYACCRIEELLDLVDLKEEREKKLKTFSGGMIRRIGIAQALLNEPEILILDEPTAGLDPRERVRFRNIISSLGKNRMVLLSTHIVSDIEYIADHILIMKNGELVQKGIEEEITKKVKGHVWKCVVPESEVQSLNNKYMVSNLKNAGEYVELRIISEMQPAVGAEMVEGTLEDAYLYHTQMQGGRKNEAL